MQFNLNIIIVVVAVSVGFFKKRAETEETQEGESEIKDRIHLLIFYEIQVQPNIKDQPICQARPHTFKLIEPTSSINKLIENIRSFDL